MRIKFSVSTIPSWLLALLVANLRKIHQLVAILTNITQNGLFSWLKLKFNEAQRKEKPYFFFLELLKLMYTADRQDLWGAASWLTCFKNEELEAFPQTTFM